MIGFKNHSYTVEMSIQVSPVEQIVLARHDNGHQWCTWIVTDMNRTGSWTFYHGHYFLDKHDALVDYWQRVSKYCKEEIDYLERLTD